MGNEMIKVIRLLDRNMLSSTCYIMKSTDRTLPDQQSIPENIIKVSHMQRNYCFCGFIMALADAYGMECKPHLILT